VRKILIIFAVMLACSCMAGDDLVLVVTRWAWQNLIDDVDQLQTWACNYCGSSDDFFAPRLCLTNATGKVIGLNVAKDCQQLSQRTNELTQSKIDAKVSQLSPDMQARLAIVITNDLNNYLESIGAYWSTNDFDWDQQ